MSSRIQGSIFGPFGGGQKPKKPSMMKRIGGSAMQLGGRAIGQALGGPPGGALGSSLGRAGSQLLLKTDPLPGTGAVGQYASYRAEKAQGSGGAPATAPTPRPRPSRSRAAPRRAPRPRYPDVARQDYRKRRSARSRQAPREYHDLRTGWRSPPVPAKRPRFPFTIFPSDREWYGESP